MRKVFAATALCFSLIAGAQSQQAERFSIATLNIDGLPQKVLVVNVNADGPGSAGTVRIGKYLMKKSFDMVFMQEDFNYHEELTAMLEDEYQLDAWSGDVGIDGHKIDFLHLQNERFECDGLMGCWKKGLNVTDGARTAWADGFGKFSHCNDLLATKGFRRYEVTLTSGTQLVVYDLHMDAEDELDTEEGKAGADRAARMNQLKQLRDDIMSKLDERPVVVLGDFNCFYFRDKLKENFVDFINDSGKATVSDVWVELKNEGRFPEYQEDNRSRDDKEEEHGGESLDKIFYINPTSAAVKVKAVSYLRDIEGYLHNGKPLGDHYPVSALFEVTDTRDHTGVEAVSETDNAPAEYYNLSGQRISQPANSGLYIERKGKDVRKRTVKY